MEKLYREGKISERIYNNYIFYRKAFWICFVYVLWDIFNAFGWI